MPLRIRLRHSRLLRAVALLVGAFVACDSPTEPRPSEGERVPVGQIIAGSLSPSEYRHYSFLGSAGRTYAVFVEATDGALALEVRDSATGTQRGIAFDQIGPPTLWQNATPTFLVSTDQVLQIELHAFEVATRFRMLVYEVATAPEGHAPRFTIGDTVTEVLDPIADVDEFVASGQAGQEIAGIIYGLDSGAVGILRLSVTDPTSGNEIGFSNATTNGIEVSTGRFALPGARDYQFTVRALPFGSRYSGRYRFRFHNIDRAPETVGAPVPLNTEIAGEAVDEFGDIDEFAFTSAADADFNVFLQGSAQPATQLEVIPAGGSAVSLLQTVASDTGLFQHGTGRFHVSPGGGFTLRASALTDRHTTDTGAYRFYVYQVNPLPEHVASAITPGDTVSGESIDLPGDIDEFSFSAAAGAEFNVLFQPQVANGAILRAEVIGPAGPIASVEGYGPASDLFQLVTGRFTASTAGTYHVRVTGAGSTTPLHTGPYRLFLYQVERHPESAPQQLTLGDSVSGEAIDLPGDVDEFTVAVPESSGVEVELQIDAAPGFGEAVRAMVFPQSGDSLGYVDVIAAGTQRGMESLHLGPGTYTIRIEGIHYNHRSVVRTRYELWAYRFQFEPEVAADTFALGDTVSGEALNVPGDVDRFYFYGDRGQLVNIALQGMSAASTGSFQLMLIGPGPYANPFLFIQSSTEAAALGDHQTTRLDLPFTGWYRIEITGGSPGGNRQETGLYRFAVELLDAGPEHVSATLTPGDSVTAESIDALGDWDQFTITTTPGDEIAAVFSAAPLNGSYVRALVFDSATGEPFFELTGAGTGQTGPILVPGSGHLAVALREYTYSGRFCIDATCGGLFHFVGPYRLDIVRVNRAPEIASAVYALGDTVRGESIAPIGDIDEFSGSGTPGTVLHVFYRMAAATVPPDGSIQLQVIDPATQAVQVGNDYAAVDTSFFTPGSFTVPASGTFLVRIRAYPATGVTTVPYEFVIKP